MTQSPDRDSIRIAKQFAEMYRSGAQGAEMDCDAAQTLALSLDDILAALAPPVGAEPVAWRVKAKLAGQPWRVVDDLRVIETNRDLYEVVPLYASPTPPDDVAEGRDAVLEEPVAWRTRWLGTGDTEHDNGTPATLVTEAATVPQPWVYSEKKPLDSPHFETEALTVMASPKTEKQRETDLILQAANEGKNFKVPPSEGFMEKLRADIEATSKKGGARGPE